MAYIIHDDHGINYNFPHHSFLKCKIFLQILHFQHYLKYARLMVFSSEVIVHMKAVFNMIHIPYVAE